MCAPGDAHKKQTADNSSAARYVFRKISKGYSMFYGFVPNLRGTASEPFSYGCDLVNVIQMCVGAPEKNGSPRS